MSDLALERRLEKVMALWRHDRAEERRLGPFHCPQAWRDLHDRLLRLEGPYAARAAIRRLMLPPTAARDVAPGECWAFPAHRAQDEVAA